MPGRPPSRRELIMSRATLKSARTKKSTSKITTKKQVENIAADVQNKKMETKVQYTDIDELVVHQFGEVALTPFNLLSQGTAGNNRIGQKIDPLSLSLTMYFRPKGLNNQGGLADQDEQFDSACYSRIIIVRQKPGVKYIGTTPTPIATNSAQLMVGNGGTVRGLHNDYRDLMRSLNTKFFTVIYDKKHYIPMQYTMKNTKEVNFNYSFPKSVRNTYSDNSEYPDQPVFMFIINRFADDDTHAINKNIEYTGEAVFRYKDA